MIEIGKYNDLEILRETSIGLYLGTADGEDVLLPNKYCPGKYNTGDTLRVFVYPDNEGRKIATTLIPKVLVNEFAFLQVKAIEPVGAFLDWGLDKDLFVPHREQIDSMNQGQSYLVYMYLDEETNRLAATQKVDKYLDNETITVEEGDKVDLWIWKKTDLGYKVVINEQHEGLIYHNEFFTDVNYGDQETGYIKKIREDQKIDVTLRPIGYKKVEPNADHIMQRLQQVGGYLDLHDKSDPDEIRDRLEMSKKTFKKAIGRLYSEDLIRIEDDGIYLVD